MSTFAFGAPAPASAGGFSFASTPAPVAGFSFGGTPAPAAGGSLAFSTSSFGNTSGFGSAPKPAQAAPAPFSWNLSSAGSTSTVGVPTTQPFGGPQYQQPAHAGQTGMQTGGVQPRLTQAIHNIYHAYADTITNGHPNAKSHMQGFMYNVVSEPQRRAYRPPEWVTEDLWQKAKDQNPDPDHLVPVFYIGFAPLQKRVELHQEVARTHQQQLEANQEAIQDLQQRVREAEVKAQDCRIRSRQLESHLLQTMAKVESLRLLNMPLDNNERDVAAKLKGLEQAAHRGKGMIEELRSTLSQLPPRVEAVAQPLSREDETNMFEMLQKLRDYIEPVMAMVRKDERDVDIVRQAVLEDGDPHGRHHTIG